MMREARSSPTQMRRPRGESTSATATAMSRSLTQRRQSQPAAAAANVIAPAGTRICSLPAQFFSHSQPAELMMCAPRCSVKAITRRPASCRQPKKWSGQARKSALSPSKQMSRPRWNAQTTRGNGHPTERGIVLASRAGCLGARKDKTERRGKGLPNCWSPWQVRSRRLLDKARQERPQGMQP